VFGKYISECEDCRGKYSAACVIVTDLVVLADHFDCCMWQEENLSIGKKQLFDECCVDEQCQSPFAVPVCLPL